ncbi:hypothetical protein M5K25_024471 [Dendrobium thyrsiflorum]|uniref:Uncharacterized protein n=1 Tax=Dendrobium thyrsiflorum TaxID=117978 RepID=A0ABD0U220_DENTH
MRMEEFVAYGKNGEEEEIISSPSRDSGLFFRARAFLTRSIRAGFEVAQTASCDTLLMLRRVEGKRGRAWEREEEICEGEFVRVFTKVAPSKGSVHLLRASSRIFEGLGGVHFSEKKRFSAGFGWKQKEVRFSAGFRRKRKESKVLCLTGNTAAPSHNAFTSGLGKDARTIQHVLRCSVIPKAGDRIHITPLLSLTTFYIMAHRDFNASDLIIRYFENLTTIRDPRHHRRPNLALGHLVSYVLTTKYNLEFPSTSTSPTYPPTFFSNNSFHILHSTRLHPEQGEAGEEAEEAQPEQAPDPVPAPAPLRLRSQIDQLADRFDAFETRFDNFETHQQQFQTRMYEYIDQQQQQRIEDRAWFAEQFDILQRYHPLPPPPPDGDGSPFPF